VIRYLEFCTEKLRNRDQAIHNYLLSLYAKSEPKKLMPYLIEQDAVGAGGIDLSTARPKWRLDGPALSGHLLYSLVNHAYANRYYYYLVR